MSKCCIKVRYICLKSFACSLWVLLHLPLHLMMQFYGGEYRNGKDWDDCPTVFLYSALSLVLASLPHFWLPLSPLGNFENVLKLLAEGSRYFFYWKSCGPDYLYLFHQVVSLFQNVIDQKLNKIMDCLFPWSRNLPEVDIPEGVFYDEIDGYNLYVAIRTKTGMLYDVLIYNFEKGLRNAQIIKSDSTSEMTSNIYICIYTVVSSLKLIRTWTKGMCLYRRESIPRKACNHWVQFGF